MKWYFASRVRHTENLVKASEFLVSQGQEIVSTWIYGKSLKPYHEHVQEAQQVGSENLQAILETDIFVLISDAEGTDMFVELGAALACATERPGSIRIYNVGEYSKRSLMQVHPAIIHVSSMEDVFVNEGINISEFRKLNMDF
ncbi:MAG: hypothetical protein JWM20_634 [Patescibacteria group bacterium]|nr:hypothetical protein [Patescibacteria group bacterium]